MHFYNLYTERFKNFFQNLYIIYYILIFADDRFILKEMSTAEMEKFLIFAPNYFEYMNKCIVTSQPTLLGKIIGVYRVCYKNATDSEKKNFLVMENLFYERRVTHKFDLKGSVRNRHVNIDDQDSEIVLLDENLLKSMLIRFKEFLKYFLKFYFDF